jgi:hypothetical protein
MRIHLFSNGSQAARAFRYLKRSRRYLVTVRESEDPVRAAMEAPDCEEGDFLYVEVTGYRADELVSIARRLRRTARCPFGLVYAGDGVQDAPRLFFAGASDVLDPAVLERGVTVKRMDEVLRFLGRVDSDGPRRIQAEETDRMEEVPLGAEPAGPYILSGSDWNEIEPSHEYTFWLLFAELDHVQEYAEHSTEAHTEEVAVAFRKHLLAAVSPYQGRSWIWKRFGGLILFPFDGERCRPVVPMMRLLFNRALANVEAYPLKSELSFRLALHLGNTVYESAGKTGDIVSETVNFIFHLGQRHLEPGELAVTAEAFSFVPDTLRPLFERTASLEGHAVYRFKRFRRGTRKR